MVRQNCDNICSAPPILNLGDRRGVGGQRHAPAALTLGNFLYGYELKLSQD